MAPLCPLPPVSSHWSAAIFRIRAAALRRIEELYPRDLYSQAMMKAILLGDSTNLERVWTDHFRRTGTFHALVISGLHIIVLAGTLLYVLRFCMVPESIAALVAGSAAWLYTAVSGNSAPAVRAAAGFTLYMLAKITGDLSKAGLMAPLVAAALPPAIGGITGLLVLLHQEDG